MFYRLFAFLALVAVAFAIPRPEPQAVAYPGAYPAAYSNYGGEVYGAAQFPAMRYAYNQYYNR